MNDGAVGLVQRRRHISREEAKQLVVEYEASGLTRQAFCAGRGLSVASLDKYRRRHGQGTGSSEGRLMSVEVIPGASASSLSQNGVTGPLR
ncbi:MAG: IS66 family insertion sequence element accessory protein TnpA [Acidobacteriaceae bacterium]